MIFLGYGWKRTIYHRRCQMTRRSLKKAFWDNMRYDRIQFLITCTNEVTISRTTFDRIPFTAWAKNRIDALRNHEIPLLRRMNHDSERYRRRLTKLETLCIILATLTIHKRFQYRDIVRVIKEVMGDDFCLDGVREAMYVIVTNRTIERDTMWRYFGRRRTLAAAKQRLVAEYHELMSYL